MEEEIIKKPRHISIKKARESDITIQEKNKYIAINISKIVGEAAYTHLSDYLTNLDTKKELTFDISYCPTVNHKLVSLIRECADNKKTNIIAHYNSINYKTIFSSNIINRNRIYQTKEVYHNSLE